MCPKCTIYTALAASKEHVDKENRTYITSIMPQDDQYSSIPCRSNLSRNRTRSSCYVTTYGTCTRQVTLLHVYRHSCACAYEIITAG